MTRQEFVDGVNSFWDLIEFCHSKRLDICDCLIDRVYLDEYLMDYIRNLGTWTGIRDFLSDIPADGEYYADDECGYIMCVDDMFDDYKNDTIRVMDQLGAWDEEDLCEESNDADAETDIDDASFLDMVGRNT